MEERKKNIFVMGLDPFNLRLLKSVRRADRYEFHGLLSYDEVAAARTFDVEMLLDKARSRLRDFGGSVDAIVGYWDFPTILMMPILRREFGLRGPTLESVLRTEHKYWSRLEQKKVVPDEVPAFELVDPFADDAADRIGLDYPFWIKPVKAHSSLLGFRIDDRGDLDHALAEIRAGIHRFADPLDVIMSYADLPEEIRRVGGRHCIAEAIISQGRQCTLEGFSFQGDVRIYGIVDSHRAPNRSSLERYEYPSSLPEPVKARMRESARRVVGHLGLDDTPFNIEFFYDADTDRIWLLEINARISKSHSPLFEKVDGVPHKEVMIDIALGRRPEAPDRQGRFRYAAKYMPRLYGDHDDEVVRNVPDENRLQDLHKAYEGAQIQLHLEEGMRLADIPNRDPYSYELGAIFIGADSREGLQETFDRLWSDIGLRFEKAKAA